MYKVLTCLTEQHDYRLVALAALICIAAAFSSFRIFSHVASSTGIRRLCLLVLTGICSGSGIWATHFIAMLAYDAGFPIAYEPYATAASLLIAVTATTLGFTVSASGTRWQPATGGIVIGFGIGFMHYTGMYALVLVLHWETLLVFVSMFIGVALATAAMLVFHKSQSRRRRWMAAGIFALAICGLHFTAMGAATVLPHPSIYPSPINASLMVIAVSGVTLVILLSGIASTALMENYMRRQREEDLRIQNLRFDMALANMGDGLCMFDSERRLVVCNDRYAKMYHLPAELLQPGTHHHEIIKHRVKNGILKGDTSERAAEHVLSTLHTLPEAAPSSRVDELSDGRLICVTREPMMGGGWVATHKDVTEQQRSEARITYLAQHDSLTDLPNRALMRARLEQALAATRRSGRQLAVLMLDLDRFKDVNDTLGHPVGDALLKAVAARLRKCCREETIVARLGGDEFAVLEEMKDLFSEASALANRIQESLAAPFDLGDFQVITGTSIGIAAAPSDGTDCDDILKKADLALYRAKSGGRGSHRFFEPEMDHFMQARRALERDMRCSIANGEFELHYQPFVDLRTGQMSGCEALLRWHHPERGLVMPGEFITLAEETGLIVPLGEWALLTACAEAAKWPEYLKISVNISTAQFRSADLVQSIANALNAFGLAPERLELEVTESAIMHDSQAVFSTLRQLHKLGVRVALDDFGTGYSSLSFLQKFPFDKIKIDCSFIRELMSTNKEERVVARAVVRFAASLGRTATAEGVETKKQLRFLRAEGCSEMQGYYFSRPLRAEDFSQMLLTQSKKASSAA